MYLIYPVVGDTVVKRGLSSDHDAVDIAPIKKNLITLAALPCVATADGIVTYVGLLSGYNHASGITGRAKCVVILHPDGSKSGYFHLNDYTVKILQKVKQGDLVGHTGNTGNVIPLPTPQYPGNGEHLHFSYYVKNLPADFRAYLGKEPMSETPKDKFQVIINPDRVTRRVIYDDVSQVEAERKYGEFETYLSPLEWIQISKNNVPYDQYGIPNPLQKEVDTLRKLLPFPSGALDRTLTFRDILGLIQ